MSNVPDISLIEFDRRWTAWKARGRAHERVVRRRFVISAIALAMMVLTGIVRYWLLAR